MGQVAGEEPVDDDGDGDGDGDGDEDDDKGEEFSLRTIAMKILMTLLMMTIMTIM